MQTKLLHHHAGLRTYVAVLDTGDEVMACLQRFIEAEALSAAQITALGAFESAELYFFEWETKEYRPIPVNEQTEVATLVGDVALDGDGKPSLHLHVVLGKADGTALAGHLAQARVRPTLEVMITETPAHLHRLKDQKTGLALIRPKEGADASAIGQRVWAIAEGYIPSGGVEGDETLVSHETACILNAQDTEARIDITLFFVDRAPVGPYRVTVPAQRTLHLRFNDLKDPAPVPRDTDFATLIKSDVPIVVQHTRLDSRHPNVALLSTMAFAG